MQYSERIAAETRSGCGVEVESGHGLESVAQYVTLLKCFEA